MPRESRTSKEHSARHCRLSARKLPQAEEEQEMHELLENCLRTPEIRDHPLFQRFLNIMRRMAANIEHGEPTDREQAELWENARAIREEMAHRREGLA